jgi:Tfp pilus assembly protein FimV
MRTTIRAAATALLILLVGAAGASATQPDEDGEHKVAICHRTASDSNPYVFIEVDVASLDAHLNNLPGHPAKTNPDGTPRNDYLAESAADCEEATPSASPTPTTTPSSSPTPEPSSSPTASPSSEPTPRPSPSSNAVPSATPSAPLPVPSVPATDTESSATSSTSNPFALALVVLSIALLVGWVVYRDFRPRKRSLR